MNQNQFLQITRKMEQRYGKMKKNEEDNYAILLFPMESNLLKIHRMNPSANSRRLEEAILLTLYEVENRINEEHRDVSKFENRENTLLKNALLESFDPFVNEEIKAVLHESRKIDLKDKESLIRYYKEPVICILRIKDSVEHWLKRNGSDGYFDFLEKWFGNEVPNDDEMKYAISVGTGEI